MLKQTHRRLSRRHFLKGAAHLFAVSASALSIGGASGLAFADTVSPKQGAPNRADLSSVTLLNQSDKTVVLDAAQPVSLEQVHGWVVVKLNKVSEQDAVKHGHVSSITLAAGQQRSFAVDSELAPALQEAGSHIVITNEYSALDNMVPMATYDVVVV